MINHLSKPNKLLLVLTGLFIASIIVAELIGVKLFSLEDSLGIPKFSFSLLGQNDLSLVLSVGVLPWPIIFILTDVINDYYGFKTVKFISVTSVFIITISFLIISLAIQVSPDTGWWQTSKADMGISNMNTAFLAIFDQGRNIILASVVAFLVGQLVDALIFRQIKKITKDKYIGLRATVSTLVSQLIDSLLVTLIAFYLLADMSFQMALALALTAYIYKFTVAVLSTPILYGVHFIIKKYLGHDVAQSMRMQAINHEISS
jgi:uncharacterized integral membrane protein (TIGR00697 family)